MRKVARRDCTDCGEEIGPTQRHWAHVTLGGLKVDHFCEDCMLGQVRDYAAQSIEGMLEGKGDHRIFVAMWPDGSEVKPPRSGP